MMIYCSFSDVKYILKVNPSGWFTMNLTSVHKKHVISPWWEICVFMDHNPLFKK